VLARCDNRRHIARLLVANSLLPRERLSAGSVPGDPGLDALHRERAARSRSGIVERHQPMKCFTLNCQITLEAESGKQAFDWLLDFCTNHDIAVIVDSVEDEDGNSIEPPK
jgi:hypothetical protein